MKLNEISETKERKIKSLKLINSKILRFFISVRIIADKAKQKIICLWVRIIHKNRIGRCEKKKKNWVDTLKRMISVIIKKSDEYKTTLI